MLNLPDRHLSIVEPGPPEHGSWSGKPAPRLASPTQVYDSGNNATGETIRMKKFTLSDGRELYVAADGSGRLFKRRQSGLGVMELTPEEAVDLGYAPEVAPGDED